MILKLACLAIIIIIDNMNNYYMPIIILFFVIHSIKLSLTAVGVIAKNSQAI